MTKHVHPYDHAMRITDQAEADAYLETLIVDNMEASGRTRAEADEIVRENLAICAGYFSHETRARVERLFRCKHPMLGAIAEVGTRTPEQNYELGAEMMRALRAKRGL